MLPAKPALSNCLWWFPRNLGTEVWRGGYFSRRSGSVIWRANSSDVTRNPRARIAAGERQNRDARPGKGFADRAQPLPSDFVNFDLFLFRNHRRSSPALFEKSHLAANIIPPQRSHNRSCAGSGKLHGSFARAES
jgi:hypothetical protein